MPHKFVFTPDGADFYCEHCTVRRSSANVDLTTCAAVDATQVRQNYNLSSVSEDDMTGGLLESLMTTAHTPSPPIPGPSLLSTKSKPKLTRSKTVVWASGRQNVRVVVTGIAAAVPGRGKAVFVPGVNNIQRIIAGENFITPIPNEVKDAMLEKNIVELVKGKDGKTFKRSITKHEENINLCATMGDMSLTEYGVSESIAGTMDRAVQIAISAGLEALKDSGIVSGKGGLESWVLPASMQETTGVVYATSFPALDAVISEVTRYYESKLLTQQSLGAIQQTLRASLAAGSPDGVISPSVLEALNGLENEVTAAVQHNQLHNGHGAHNGTVSKTDYEFDRKFLFRVLVLGNAQLAQIVKARGPNMQTNAACAGATQAVALAFDLIQVGRAERMIVIAGDNASSDTLMPWIGNGFRALGAATIAADVAMAAMPFDARRSGMILGSGAIGMILESEGGARRRFDAQLEQLDEDAEMLEAIERSKKHSKDGQPDPSLQVPAPYPFKIRQAPFHCRLLSTLLSNSAYHGASMDKDHIAAEMERFIVSIENEQGIAREDLARNGVYFSHETSTHASATQSCAFNELYGLRKVFGEDLKHLLILNTKGFTGHPMGVSFEDVVASEVLVTGLVPPIAHYSSVDPSLGTDLKMSRGGRYPCKYAIRFAAGFGSQIALALYGAANT